MIKEKMSDGGRFLALFNKIKKPNYCGDDPAKIPRCYKESSNFKKIADDLYWLHYRISRALASSGEKVIPHVHDDFPLKWQDFEKRWLPEISDVQPNNIYLEELIEKLINDTERSESDGREESQNDFEPPDYEYEEEFDPMQHDPGYAIDMGISYLEDQIGVKEGLNDTLANQLRIALGGWNFLEKAIGIDFSDIARRWRSIPIVYIPQHVSNHHGLEEGSLYDMLKSTHMAYVYGLYDPCIVMCRALSEKILKKHYPAQWTEWKDNKEQNRPLKTVVKELQEGRWGDEGDRYIKLIRLIEIANSILHSGDRNRKNRTDEGYALLCLTVVKEFIENAPRKVKTT